MTRQITAGTAGDRFRCDDAPHAYADNPRRDPGEREKCRCGCERDEPGARHERRK